MNHGTDQHEEGILTKAPKDTLRGRGNAGLSPTVGVRLYRVIQALPLAEQRVLVVLVWGLCEEGV
jgi:hypothetical protein